MTDSRPRREVSAPADSPDDRTDWGAPPRAPASIFRRRAVERYVRRTEQQVLPQLGSPREIAWLWLAVALLTAGCLLAGVTLDSSTRDAAGEVHPQDVAGAR